ncbi:hypothetical protein Q2941_37135 [Bradyrhizobium sp. UFLA05-153]
MDGKSKAEIAEQFGCTVGTLTVTCSKAKISLRRGGRRQPKQPPLSEAPPLAPPSLPENEPCCFISRRAMTALRKRAAAMGCSETKLVSDLLEVIARDNLYDAVLDDQPQPTKEVAN